LGEKTLAERLQSRLALRKVLDYMEQALEALAFAHGERIIHCDIKPENFILFPGDYLRLTDFGIAKVGMRTVAASGSGTVGYVAPEQAMGRPSFKSDVFSMGLILYRMLSGHLPEWPFLWPPAGFDRVRRRTHPDLIALIRRAMEVKPARRFPDATHMLEAFLRVKKKALRYASLQARRRKARTVLVPLAPNWKEVRTRQFQRLFGRALETRLTCHACGGPVSEPMHYCPWCGKVRKPARESTRFPVRCPRCKRGVKLDWRYCPWCFGERIGEEGGRSYSDRRYASRCMNSRCTRKDLMAFMRYCPWCRRKVQRPWKLPGSKDRCASCGWGVLPAFWNVCPWCGKTIKK
jgi:hypothetical protein